MERVCCLDCVYYEGNKETITCNFEDRCNILNPEDCMPLEDRPLFKGTLSINPITEKEWDDILENINVNKSLTWLDLEEKEKFLQFVEDYTKDNKGLLSDSFTYIKHEDIPDSNIFERYCYELYDFIDNYADKYFIRPLNCESRYYDKEYGVVINGVHYSISLVHGQGSYVSINRVQEIEGEGTFIMYEDIMSNKSVDIKEGVKSEILKEINNISFSFALKGVNETLIKEILTEIIIDMK